MDRIIWRILGNNQTFYPLNKRMEYSSYCFPILHANKQKLFFKTCKYNKLDMMKILIPYVDASAKNNYAIRWASKYGDLEVVKFLASLPNVDASIIKKIE